MRESIEANGLGKEKPGSDKVKKFMEEYVRNWLKTSVIPGYGHGRLRTTDPRYTHLKGLSLSLISDSYLVQLVHAAE